MNYGNGSFYLDEIGDFRLAQNGCFHPASTQDYHKAKLRKRNEQAQKYQYHRKLTTHTTQVFDEPASSS